MSNTTRNLVGGAAAFALLVVAVGFGLYMGGRAFAQLQHVPVDSVSLTTLHDYWIAYGGNKKVKLALLIGCAVAVFIPAVPTITLVAALLIGPKRELYGSARFAYKREVWQAGLFGDDKAKWPGVLLGKVNGEYLIYNGQEFVSLRAPTRAYKGVGCVIPNLLTYPHSVVNTDIKLENWVRTAGFRSDNGQECYLFAPTHEKMISDEWSHVFNKEFQSHRWNPLSYIRPEYEYRIGDIQSQGTMWWPTGGKNGFFNDNARDLFLGLTLYAMETPGEPVTLANLLQLTTPADGSALHDWIMATIKKREAPDGSLPRLSPECVDTLRTFASNPDKTRGNILSTFRTPLAIFRDPRLAAATSGDDFDLRDVRRKKMSIYIGMTPEDLLKYNTLMNVFFSQLLNENTRVLPEHDPSLKYQCLLLLDEFPALGRIGIIEKAVGYMAGYNMRLVLIYQNKGQLIGQDGQGYGERGAQNILGNCSIKMLYQPEDEEDAEEYSKALGTQTVKARSRSRGTGRGGGSTNTTDSDQRRPLMLPQELKEMGLDKVIITSKLCKPIFADKIMYFKDDELKDRADLPTPPIPRMEIVRLQHRTRLLTVIEVATIQADDIANKAEILAAVGKAIGFDFSAFVVAVPAAPAAHAAHADQVNVAKAA